MLDAAGAPVHGAPVHADPDTDPRAAQSASGPAGRFLLVLKPGHYDVWAAYGATVRTPVVRVRVRRGELTPVRLAFPPGAAIPAPPPHRAFVTPRL